MAQLKDSVVSGNLRVTDTTLTDTLQVTTIKAPTSSGGTTYGPGTSGQVLKSNGSSVYWTSDNNANYYHKTGTWNGLTYTAAKVGSPEDLAFTIPTGNTASTVALGNHTHDYLPLAGGTMTGVLTLKGEQYNNNYAMDCNNSNIIHINALRFNDNSESYTEGISFPRITSGYWDTIWAKGGEFYFTPNHETDVTGATSYKVLHTNNTSFSSSLSSGTKIGTITIAGTATDIYCQTNTDTKVTSAANHYTPATASGSDKTASASGATAAWSIDVVKGVTLNTDGKGHVTGISVTSGKIPGNPVPSNAKFTDENVKQTPTTSSNTSYRPVLVGMDYGDPGYTATEKTDAVYAVPRVMIKPSTGDLVLYSGGDADSPSLTFQRGTPSDGTYDWKLYVTGGHLNFNRNNAGTWTNLVQFEKTGKLYVSGTIYSNNTPVSLDGHTHDYLPTAGGTMEGNISFKSISGNTYPIASNKIIWNGGTDGIDIYYNLRASDAGELIMNMRDDTNVRISFAYNGTVKSYIDTNGNFSGNSATASSWATARTLTLGGQLTGSVSVKGNANMTLNGYMDRAFIYDDNAVPKGHTWAEYAWHKFAEVTITTTWTDCVITFLVSRTYSSSAENAGILSAKLRTKGRKDYDSAQLKWLVRNSGLSKDDFVMVYTSTSGTSTKAELWCRLPDQYHGLIFTVLKEHKRQYSTDVSWTLVKTPDESGSTHGSSSYPTTGITDKIISSDGTITNSTTGNATSADALNLTHGNELNFSKLGSTGHVWFGYRWNTQGTETSGGTTITKYKFGNANGAQGLAGIEANSLILPGGSGTTTLQAKSQTTDGTYLLPDCGNGTYTLSIGMTQVGGTGDSLVMSNVSGIPQGTKSFKIVFKSNASLPIYSMVEIPNIGDGVDCGGLIQVGDYTDGQQGSLRIVMKSVVIRVTAGSTTGTKTFTATVSPTQKISGSSVSEFTRNVIIYKIYACC